MVQAPGEGADGAVSPSAGRSFMILGDGLARPHCSFQLSVHQHVPPATPDFWEASVNLSIMTAVVLGRETKNRKATATYTWKTFLSLQ